MTNYYHNGNIYKYKVLGEFNKDFIDMSLDRVNAIIYNKEKYSEKFEEKLQNALKSLKENNVELEVFLWT